MWTVTGRTRSAQERIDLSAYFFFDVSTTTEIYTLSLHDALPISLPAFELAWCAAQQGEAAFFAESRNIDRKSTRLNSSHMSISYAVFCLKKKKAPTTASPNPSRAKSSARNPRSRVPEPLAHGGST